MDLSPYILRGKHRPCMGKLMEVMVPSPNMDFDFNSARSLPYLSTPSTPRRFGNYFYSVPSSPSRVSDFYGDLDHEVGEKYDPSERVPGSPDVLFETKEDSDDEDFAFDVSEQMERISLSAEELFDGGKIRASTPPPQLLIEGEVDQSRSIERSAVSPKSARSSILYGKQIVQSVFSPRRKDLDLSKTSVENGRKRATNERGRERNLTSNSSTQRTARSLSPSRDSETPWEIEKQQRQQNSKPLSSNSKSATTSSSSSSSSRSSKRWSLKDLLLFRSASEGRATDRDPLRKYYGSFRKHEDSKTSSFASKEAKSAKRKESVSPHELHYTVNKAVSEDMKKRTFLPYNQGILGRLSFNPAIHALSNGFGSLPHA